MRTCPTCRTALVEGPLEGEQVDRCPGCAGMFFDRGELGSVVELVRVLESVVLREPEIDLVPGNERARLVQCPEDGSSMEPEEIAGLVADRCPLCGGVWLDGGEITALKLAEAGIRRNLGLFVRLGS